ncbi:IclR family transcriptional regulator [Falsiroseomonas sp. HW251]|uniref:IclR family transcriptional regulator n=1 Tax=Falsiroseomonas sp. HW251 TaxID=3390998 RepID=UPI003D3222F3
MIISGAEAPAGTHRIPAVERAVDLLEALASAPAGIRELTARLGIPRSTVYRVLNSLEARGLVVRGAENAYSLGPQLLRLARAVPSGFDLVAVARPLMDELARALRCSVKLSVREGEVALVVATAESPETYSVTTQVGRRFPLHAGAASKVLAAFGPEEVQARLLAAPLARLTPATITEADALRRVLEEVRRDRLAMDAGEFAPGIRAVAAPVFGPEGICVAALSIPYLDAEAARRERPIREGLRRCAGAISARLGGA